MSDANAQTEPTMEEILSSIRRIISEDDEPRSKRPRKSLCPLTRFWMRNPSLNQSPK